MSALEVKIGENVRALRLAAALTQTDLAERCTRIRAGVGLRGAWTQASVSGIERGDRARFDFVELLVLTEALGCTLNDLFADASPHSDEIIDALRDNVTRLLAEHLRPVEAGEG